MSLISVENLSKVYRTFDRSQGLRGAIVDFFRRIYRDVRAVFSNLYNVGNTYIIEGHLDRVLLRPLNSFFQVLMEKVAVERVVGFVLSGAIMAYAAVSSFMHC